MWKRSQYFLLYQPKSLRELSLIKSLRKQQIEEGVVEEDVDNHTIAEQAGLIGATTISLSKINEEKLKLIQMIEHQKERRIARHEAFLTWQAAQRERGSAHRLLRQASQAERQKRNHYSSLEGRVLNVLCTNNNSNNTRIENNTKDKEYTNGNNDAGEKELVDINSSYEKVDSNLARKAASSMTDFFIKDRTQRTKHSIYLTLNKK